MPVSRLSGVGVKLESRLQRLGIRTIEDLLFHLPHRYMDRTRLIPIGSLVPGQEALAQGNVELTQIQYGRRRSLLCRISDGTGALTLRFFHFNKLQQTGLARGTCIRCWGVVRRGIKTLEMIHPEYQHIAPEELDHVDQTLTPVYPATEGLSQGRLRKLSDQALNVLKHAPNQLTEILPGKILSDYRMPGLAQALQYVHRPPPDADIDALKAVIHPAQRRLAFEELLAHHLSLRAFRKQIQAFQAPPFNTTTPLIDEFTDRLPFQLTRAQQTVLREILHDIKQDVPMLRLLQGDVGSGKTVVAVIAALQAIAAGYQVALMAPTELLADQHYFNLQQWLSGFDVPVLLFSGKLGRSTREQALTAFAASAPLIAVGTHALFQEGVKFGHLGFIIIDEQHRFGVHQRLALFEKGAGQTHFPHQLIMTATPIPRTIAMTVFADLDISIVDELPPGRQPVNTVVMANERRAEIIERIANVCKQGRQVYWVCMLIEESDAIQSQAATDTCEYLDRALPDLTIGLIHGRMKSSEKEQIMSRYKSGALDLLVATTVIEVGVDVPAASLMVIENAERLGLSQLHQLRGRIGRGAQQSDCILMYQPPLSEIAQTRLTIMRTTNDGFEIAKKDLELRGPGEILGTRQTGLPAMHIADLMRDAALIPQVQKAAQTILSKYPNRIDPLIGRWLESRTDFGNV